MVTEFIFLIIEILIIFAGLFVFDYINDKRERAEQEFLKDYQKYAKKVCFDIINNDNKSLF